VVTAFDSNSYIQLSNPFGGVGSSPANVEVYFCLGGISVAQRGGSISPFLCFRLVSRFRLVLVAFTVGGPLLPNFCRTVSECDRYLALMESVVVQAILLGFDRNL
jgi:hypothetical protein